MLRCFSAVLVLLAVSSCLAAADEAVSAQPESRRINVYASGLPVQTVLARIAKDAGLEIYVDAAASASLDLALTDVTATQALDAICRATALQWTAGTTDSSGKPVYLVRVRSGEAAPPVPSIASKPSASPAASNGDAAGQPRHIKIELPPEEGEQEKQAQSRPLDAGKALEFLKRASRINIYSSELPPIPSRPIIRYRPPLLPPVYTYGYEPIYAYPPPIYGGYWVGPVSQIHYYPLGTVVHTTRSHTSYGLGVKSGGVRLEYSHSKTSGGLDQKSGRDVRNDGGRPGGESLGDRSRPDRKTR